MDIYAEIARTVQDITGNRHADIFPAQIHSVNGSTCSIVIGSLQLTDVRLRAVVNDKEEQLLITPKQGSMVLVADLSGGNYRDLAVIAFSEIEKIEIKAAQAEVVIKDGKVSVKNNRQNLYSLLTDLIDALTAITVTTATGPSGTPINATQFTAIKTRLGQLMQ